MKKNAIHNNTIKQYLEIAAIRPKCLSGRMLCNLHMTVKYFNFQFTLV